MKKANLFLFIILAFTVSVPKAQTVYKEYKVGHPIFLSLPDYMSKTAGINAAAAVQYKSVVKDVYGFVIEDNKEEMGYVDMNYSNINEFYDDFIKGFTKDLEKAVVSTPLAQKKGETNFIEADLSYYDTDAKADIYYLVGIVETKTSYYKVLSWAAAENKDKFKADFQKILYSLKD
jgi:hypothetical protein